MKLNLEDIKKRASEARARGESALAKDVELLISEVTHLRSREESIIEACERVADGGQYRADIVSAINRIRSERDAALADAKKWRELWSKERDLFIDHPID